MICARSPRTHYAARSASFLRILKDAPILILDEATSSLDSITEQQIQAALDEAMQGKTVIVIAHRLSTIAHLDRILVFSRGEVVEEGTHDALLARRGAYHELWQRQSGGLLPETIPTPRGGPESGTARPSSLKTFVLLTGQWNASPV
jgi:ATP-binding cassette subfamily B protein